MGSPSKFLPERTEGARWTSAPSNSAGAHPKTSITSVWVLMQQRKKKGGKMEMEQQVEGYYLGDFWIVHEKAPGR